MRSAPSVSHPVGRSRFGARLLAGLWLSGLAAGFVWLVPGPFDPWRAAVWAAVLAGCGVWGWRWCVGQGQGQLSWDGAVWHWLSGLSSDQAHDAHGDPEMSVTVSLDLQSVLLVRCIADGGGPLRARWLWLEAGTDAAHWRALRRAVYSPAPQAPSAQTRGGASHP